MRNRKGVAKSLLNRLVAGIVVTAAGFTSQAAVEIIGAQYRQDRLFPEFNCYYSSGNYPTSCPQFLPGATVCVLVKNAGTSPVTITDATLAGYSLQTVIKMSTSGTINPDQQNSIYFYWDNPPQQIFDAGEPVWWKADPPTVPAGGVAQVAVRLRSVPVTPTVAFGVVNSAGPTLVTNIAVDANAPCIASIGYSEDLRKIYLHWRRDGGAAPTSVWLDGVDVTSLTTTVGDPSLNFAASVISLPNPLPFFSYHAYQGVYADGKTAAAGQRAWTNKFVYCTWSTFEASGSYDAPEWVDEAAAHGFNNVEMNLGLVGGYLGTSAGRAHLASKGYGYTILDKSKLNQPDPDFWFINDEPDAEENNQGNTHCGTGLRLPCDARKYAGTLVMKEAVRFASELRALRPNVPITVNLDGGLQPQSWYTWGPAVDVLESNNYYEVRLRDSWFFYPNRLPLHRKPLVSYAVARSGTEGASPNPFRHILYSCKGQDPDWPYPYPASKHIEAYYSLAGGTKGFGYWWFNSPRGLYNSGQSPALWKEMGLIGNEVKTARNLIVRSTPVDLPLTPGNNVWARAVASGIDTLILYVVNDNFANDITGCQVTNVPNATVTATLPSWMRPPNGTPTAFEITRGGAPGDATWVLNGSQMQISLGTLQTVRMIVITTDAQLRSATQQRYDSQVKPNLCSFAPELCVNYPPSINLQPASQSVIPGGTANFTIVAGGTSPLSYRWQKNNANLNDGGHYSGVTTSTLTITGADSGDAANYRCVVTNAFGSTNSANATLTVTNFISPPIITLQPSNQTVTVGGTAQFAVSAIGSEPLSYQWQKNDANLNDGGHYSGVTTSTLTITGADAGDAGNYRCVVTNVYGGTNSLSATLTIDLNVCVPGTLFRHGDMEDAGSYSVCPDWTSYSAGQGVASWAKETTIIHGGAASQKCRNSNGGSGSLLGVRQTFDANVGDAFTFEGWVQPVSNPSAGQQVAMIAMWDGSTANPATGSGTWNISSGLRNVWTHLQNLSGNATATSVTLFLDSRRTASSQDLTAYWDDVVCYRAHVPPPPVLSQAGGAALNVDVLPGCNTNPAAQFAISLGGGAYALGTHFVQANGTVGTTAVWQSDAAWGIKTVAGLVSGTPYTFKVQARYSSTLTQPTSLGAGSTLAPAASSPPQITSQPAPQNVCPGDAATFTVAASGDGLVYQWQTNGVNLSNNGHYSGVNGPSLTVLNTTATDAANYRCVVTNGAGSTNSAVAALTLKAATVITVEPADQEVPAGANATLSVTARGDGVLTYQWQTNGADLTDNGHYSGATSATLVVSNVTTADSADYRCVVTGGCGSVSSEAAALTVVVSGLCLSTWNGDFEGGFSLAGGGYIADHWTEWEADPGVVIGYNETDLTHGGGHAQRIRVWGGPAGTAGGVYQQVPVVLGQAYSVSVWTYAGDNLTTCSLGVDPTGGTDGTGVVWSAGSTNVAWVQQTVAGVAMADFITIYLRVSSADDAKRNGYFDDVSPGDSSEPLRLLARRNGTDLVLTWPECPNARLEWTASLGAAAVWAPVTNSVVVANGQKSVVLTPAGGAAYYRLVLE
jgi:hypothetical protein